MIRVHSTWASGASAIGVPGWPLLAFCTASMARPRITSMPRRSISVVPIHALLSAVCRWLS